MSKEGEAEVIGSEVKPVDSNEDILPNYDADPANITDEKGGVEVFHTEIDQGEETHDSSHVIVTGADAAAHLLSIRDDHDPSLTFRGMVLATILAGWLAVLQQIYTFKPTFVSLTGTFIVIFAHFIGKAWADFLPRGDLAEARWREKGGQGKPPLGIRLLKIINHGPWGLKEHAVCSITATSASNAAISSQVFAASIIFYDVPISAVNVILTTISIGTFGYGLCGILRPITVWHVESVYWSNLPIVKSLQSLHWQEVKDSKPMRYFWYAYGSMACYEILPAWIWPWLNSVSIPCLASMKATGTTGQTLTNLFGGAETNEGLGLFNLGFDWQYITSANTSLPLKYQINAAAGIVVCYICMLIVYYGNIWNAKSLPFMSTQLLTPAGDPYPLLEVFKGGVLDNAEFAKYGVPRLAGTFAWGMLIANAAIGALIAHCILFWGPEIYRSFKNARKSIYNDRHHIIMAKDYKETPWWWYALTLVFAFILGVIVCVTQDIHLPVWGLVVSLLLGSFIAPFSTILYAKYGNGIATNNLSKMVAGLILPGRPIGNMYFAGWSHNVILNTVNLSGDLKMGEYLKIPPRVMFLTQVWGTIFGGFINYVVMISIVDSNKALLATGNGNASWSGATMQAYNTNAASWALAKYIYKFGDEYYMVPLGMLIGAAFVAVQRIFVIWVPKIKNVPVEELNLAQFIQYAGYIPYNSPQTCILFNTFSAGFFVQYYLRNYRPRLFKDYSYLVTAAWDGGSLTTIFILSFAVFGAGGKSVNFPWWWGNNIDKGNYDFCPSS